MTVTLPDIQSVVAFQVGEMVNYGSQWGYTYNKPVINMNEAPIFFFQ